MTDRQNTEERISAATQIQMNYIGFLDRSLIDSVRFGPLVILFSSTLLTYYFSPPPVVAMTTASVSRKNKLPTVVVANYDEHNSMVTLFLLETQLLNDSPRPKRMHSVLR